MEDTILVTGGAGFIGSHIVDALLERGQRPIVLDDFSTGPMTHIPSDVEVLNADIADPETVDLIKRLRPSAYIHAAAQASVPRSLADPARDRDINLLGTVHVLQAAARIPGCRVVFLSTGGGIYGETETPATEQSTPKPKSFYGVHKFTAERYVEFSGVPYAIARLANVYGPRQRSDLEGGVTAIFTDRVRDGNDITIYGSGEQRRDFVHVHDVVRAVLAMLDATQNGLWNVGTGRETSVNELLALVLAHDSHSITIQRKPPRAGDVFRSCLNIDKISRDLGWQPGISIEEGVSALLHPQLIQQ